MILNVTRTIYFNILLSFSLAEWIVAELEPEKNALNWLAAAIGALIIRFVQDEKLPLKVSVGGWFTGVAIASLFASTLLALPAFMLIKPVAVWGGLALIGDLVVQLLGYILKWGRKVGGDIAHQSTGELIEDGIDKAGRIADVVLKVKNLLPESIVNLFSRKP